MIGLGRAIEIMGCGQAQLLMTKVATHIGEEIGQELKDRGTLSDASLYDDIVKAVAEFFELVPEEVSAQDGGVTVTMSQDVICPNLHIEKECPPICPLVGIFKGVNRVLGHEVKVKNQLDPKSICTIHVS